MSKLERSISARNEGFKAHDAFNEQVFETKRSIPKKIYQKEGLREYSEKEQAKRAGAVKTMNLYGPCTWKEFKGYAEDLQYKYIMSLCKLYPGINSTDLAVMFNRNSSTISAHLSSIGIHFPKGGVKEISKERLAFREKYALEEEKVSSEEVKEDSNFTIKSIKFTCDVSEVQKIIEKLNISGKKVLITVEETD